MKYNNIKSNINAICSKKTSVADICYGSKVIAIQDDVMSYTTFKKGDVGTFIEISEDIVRIYINGQTAFFYKSDIDKWLEPV